MGDNTYDRVVIGAGIIGACSAYQLVKAGHRRVLLIDQFPLPHTRGSSHGQTRVTRTAYRDLVQGQMARRSRALWADIERQTGHQLCKDVPMLLVGSRSVKSENFDTNVACLDDPTILEAQQLAEALPIADFGAEAMAGVDTTAGILRADQCLTAVTQLFTAAGGHLRSSWPVTDIVPRGKSLLVRGPQGSVTTDGLVVCAGCWAGPLLSPLGVDLEQLLTPLRIPVMYWKMRPGFSAPVSGIDIRGMEFYWVPSLEYPGLIKLCPHSGVPCNPDHRDRVSVDKLVQSACEYVARWFPGLESQPAIVETCMYTKTPDGRCIIDVHPVYSNVVIAAGMSGEGFKMGPVFGEVIQRLSDGEKSEFDLSIFSLQRFRANGSSRL